MVVLSFLGPNQLASDALMDFCSVQSLTPPPPTPAQPLLCLNTVNTSESCFSYHNFDVEACKMTCCEPVMVGEKLVMRVVFVFGHKSIETTIRFYLLKFDLQ